AEPLREGGLLADAAGDDAEAIRVLVVVCIIEAVDARDVSCRKDLEAGAGPRELTPELCNRVSREHRVRARGRNGRRQLRVALDDDDLTTAETPVRIDQLRGRVCAGAQLGQRAGGRDRVRD